MSLILKRQPDTRPSEEFWYVFDDGIGKVVGRIYREKPANLSGRKESWFWGLSHPYERGSDAIHYGNRLTRDDAMAAFKARWMSSHPGA